MVEITKPSVCNCRDGRIFYYRVFKKELMYEDKKFNFKHVPPDRIFTIL
jgi:hypothetical protein